MGSRTASVERRYTAQGDEGVTLRALANPTVLVVAVSYGLLLRIAAAAGLFGILLGFLVLLSLWRYGYAVLRDIARGRRNFPPPGPETLNPVGETVVVLHFLLFGSLTFLLVTTPLLGESAGIELLRWLLLALVAGVFPASAAVMSMTVNIGAAFSPASLVDVVRALGGDYVRVVVACVALVALLVLVERALATSWVLSLLGEAVAAWGFLALFSLIGSTLRKHRADFDLLEGLDDSEERLQRERQRDWQKTLDRAYASIRSDLPAQAYRTIRDLLASENDSLEIYQWTFNRMLDWEEREHALQLGERFVARLWDAGRKVDALELVQQCRRLSSRFALPSERTAELVAYARSIGRHRIADEISEGPVSDVNLSTPGR